MFKSFFFLVFAILSLATLSLPAFIWGIYKFKVKEYVLNIALGIDQLGGSILYNKTNWTVSGWTYVLARRSEKGKRAKVYLSFEKFINFLFQDQKHCYNAYLWDLRVDAEYELMEREK